MESRTPRVISGRLRNVIAALLRHFNRFRRRLHTNDIRAAVVLLNHLVDELDLHIVTRIV